MAMKVELTRLRIVPGKSARVDEWLQTIKERVQEAVQTLDREKMKIEVIFRERIGDEEYLSWFTVQDETGEPIGTSPFELDRIHQAFGEECIDHEYGGREGQPQVILVPDRIARAMEWTDPSASSVEYTRREIVRKRETRE